MRRRARVDSNQASIVETLRGVGAKVEFLAPLGRGVPDLLVAFRGQWYVVEFKDGALAPSRRKLTSFERAWHDEFELEELTVLQSSFFESFDYDVLEGR